MTGKEIKISYTDFHQQLNTESENVQKAYANFVKSLTGDGYKVVAITEFEGKNKKVEISVDKNGKITETAFV